MCICVQSPKGKPKTRQPANQWKEQVREEAGASYQLWQVLRVALTFPILGKSSVGGFPPLNSLLADWDRGVKRLAPTPGVGAMASQMPPASAGLPEVAGYKYTGQKCRQLHFC